MLSISIWLGLIWRHKPDSTVHAGSSAPAVLRQGTVDWILSKRQELQQLMWGSAGIRRRTKDLTSALQRLHLMRIDCQV